MEFFLIIVIIILAYLLFKGKNPSGEKIKQETKKYGSALKKAASTFADEVKKDDDRELTKKDLDNIPEELKAGSMMVYALIESLYNPVKDSLGSKFSNTIWRDELIAGFNGTLISWWLKPFTQKATQLDKGLAVQLIYYNLCPELGFKLNEEFIFYAKNPTNQSQKGQFLGNKLLDILEDNNKDKWDNDNDMRKAKEFLNSDPTLKSLSFGDGYKNNALATAFWEVNINEYILEKFH